MKIKHNFFKVLAIVLSVGINCSLSAMEGPPGKRRKVSKKTKRAEKKRKRQEGRKQEWYTSIMEKKFNEAIETIKNTSVDDAEVRYTTLTTLQNLVLLKYESGYSSIVATIIEIIKNENEGLFVQQKALEILISFVVSREKGTVVSEETEETEEKTVTDIIKDVVSYVGNNEFKYKSNVIKTVYELKNKLNVRLTESKEL